MTRTAPDTVAVDVDADSAVFIGHYPGRPVVPGVCLVDLVCRAATTLGLSSAGPGLTVRRARFMTPVLPGDRLTVAVSAVGDGEVLGIVRHDRGVACQVRLRAVAA
jgi:3-hydroxyacyl-[acyl-carrier-protein] dehydratase